MASNKKYNPRVFGDPKKHETASNQVNALGLQKLTIFLYQASFDGEHSESIRPAGNVSTEPITSYPSAEKIAREQSLMAQELQSWPAPSELPVCPPPVPARLQRLGIIRKPVPVCLLLTGGT